MSVRVETFSESPPELPQPSVWGSATMREMGNGLRRNRCGRISAPSAPAVAGRGPLLNARSAANSAAHGSRMAVRA